MYYHLLAKIKNAEMADKNSILTPFSKMDLEIAKILVKGKYLREVQKKIVNRKNFLELKLISNRRSSALKGFKILSKPGRRLYIGYRDLKPVKNGYGLAVLSTPRGLMDNREAKKNKLGGECLFEIW